MLTTEEIKKALDTGEIIELECVDINGLLERNKPASEEWKNEVKKGVVRALGIDGVHGRISISNPSHVGAFLLYEDLKYFRIKRPDPTFNDLIDVATQAVKDGLLEINKLDKDFITAKLPDNPDFFFLTSYRNKPQNFEKDILGIKSLYTETFVIEGEDDMKRIKKGAIITMVNGESITAEYDDNDLSVSFISTFMRFMPFIALKGATVTQKRGAL